MEWYCRSTPTKERYVMSEEPISLGALAYASNLYNAMTDFGSSFREFQHRVHGKPDLDDPDRRGDLAQHEPGKRHESGGDHGADKGIEHLQSALPGVNPGRFSACRKVTP